MADSTGPETPNDAVDVILDAWHRERPDLDPSAKAVTGRIVRLGSLFQQAYEGLGYPSQYFNDRLVEVIDHLLATPDVTGPIQLARPSVMYVYADPALEGLSSGQKTLLRMGPQNAAAIKAKLTELKNAVAAKRP